MCVRSLPVYIFKCSMPFHFQSSLEALETNTRMMISNLWWILRSLYVLVFLSVVEAQWWLHANHSVKISNDGNDTAECLESISIPCLTLKYVFNALKNQNSCAVFIKPGTYHLKSSVTFVHLKEFALIGLSPNSQDVVVHCDPFAGLSFIYSEQIVMENITLSSCGAVQNSTTKGHPQFLTGLFFVNCVHLTMDSVLVTDGPGIGMQLYDVTGEVRILNSHFLRNGNSSLIASVDNMPAYVNSGGGIYFEFTFRGGLWPFNAKPDPIYQKNGSFHFFNLSFEENTAPDPHINDSIVNPNGDNHVSFGRGGGVSFFLKGRAKNNKFLFINCHFNHNYAVWGGGFFVEFHDHSQHNKIVLDKCIFYQNSVKYGGGAARVGLITMRASTNIIPNVINFMSCHFERNEAIFGGAVSLYGTTKPSYSTCHDRSFTNFTSCTFMGNLATVGSAFGFAQWNLNKYGTGSRFPLKVFIFNCTITKNVIIFTEDRKVAGIGTVYSQGTPLLLKNTMFTSNYGSALVLDSSVVHVSGNVLFMNNHGRKGGAMALYGRSSIKIASKTNLTFVGNECMENGGAIYVRTSGPLLVPFNTTELNLHSCFISSENDSNSDFDPDKWDFNVSFIGNKGPFNSSGHSVFATTIQFCRKPNEARINNTALRWKSFHYFLANGSKSNMLYEIVTNAVEMEVERAEWNVRNDKHFSPTLKLFDEKHNSVSGIVSLKFEPEHEVVLDPPSTYFLVKDKIQSLAIKGKPFTHYNVTLSTVDSQLVLQDITDVRIERCSPGFVYKNNACKCDLSNIGVSRCDDENQVLFLLKGYWGGYAKNGHFVTVPCPVNYCDCLGNSSVSSDEECLFDISRRCLGNRKGQLCGMCKKNFSLKVGEDKCVDDCKSGLHWLGYLVALIIFLTILVLVIVFINFDPFSAYLNAWLYSYQIILFLLPEQVNLDPFLFFIVNLANVRIIGFGGVCMWLEMDDLQKLAFNYLLPFYVFICMLGLHRIALTCSNNCFTRRLTQTSTARAFCTLFVLSYSTITTVSLSILYPIQIGDTYFVFYEGTEEYFGSYHVGFALAAIVLLLFVGILFPLVLIRRQWFSFIDRGLTRLLLDNFQNCFRDDCRWCAGFYFVCRFIIILIATVAPPGALRVSLLQCTCCLILTVFVLCKPYRTESDGLISYQFLNTSDAILLCNLCLVCSFGGALSGIFATNTFYTGFKIVIRMLAYIPLLFSVLLFVYFVLRKYYRKYGVLTNVD